MKDFYQKTMANANTLDEERIGFIREHEDELTKNDWSCISFGNELSEDFIMPEAFNPVVADTVAAAVMKHIK